jgi:hypothetical protein
LVAPRASPSIARATLCKSELVKPPIAETTTTGRDADATLTTAVTLRKAAVSSTDVPPNFMTVGFMLDVLEDRLQADVASLIAA